MAGLLPDGRQLVNRGREEAKTYKSNYGDRIPPQTLADRMSQFVHYYTLYGSVRPFGAAVLLAGYDADKEQPWLNLVEPSGLSFRFRGVAIGKGQQAAKTEIEKHKLFNMTCREALQYIAKMYVMDKRVLCLRVSMYMLNDSTKDKPFELEMSWINADTKWMHASVPDDLKYVYFMHRTITLFL